MDVEVRLVGNQKGKGLFAKRDFKKGDVLFEEEPLVSCQFAWNKQYGYLACEYCMKPLETAEENVRRMTGQNSLILPHPECCETKKEDIAECPECGEKYCSDSCRIIAFNLYHRTLCLRSRQRNTNNPMEKLLQMWMQMHYPPETFNILLLTRMIAMNLQAEDHDDMWQRFMNFCHRIQNENFDLAHKLISERYAPFLAALLEQFSACFPNEVNQYWFTEEGFQSLLALVATNSQGIGSSPLSIWVANTEGLQISAEEKSSINDFIDRLYENLEDSVGAFLDSEASGLYTLQSACNHSCVPNAIVDFRNNNFRLSMVALKDIKLGDEILISYLDKCTLERSRHSRRKILAENYIFKCDCEKCLEQADQSDVTSEEEETDNED